jgi:lipopolysaccharide export system permease protein
MKIYRRYLMRELVAGVLLVLAAFLSLFSFFDMITEVKSVGSNASYQLVHAVTFVLLRIPGRIYELMPVAVLIGTLYALSSLARHSEITVLRASGMSTGTLLSNLLAVAAVFALATFLVGEVIAPPAERAAQQLKLLGKERAVSQELQSGLWVRDVQSFINVRIVLPDARLQGIRIHEFDKDARLRSVIEAEEGVFVPPDGWHLSGVTRTHVEDDRARIERLPGMSWRSALNPDLLSVLMVSPEKMSLIHLSAYTRHLAENKQKTQRYDIARWKKLIYPLAALVMIALALPFGYTHDRVSGVSLKIFVGVMIGVLFHMLNGLFSNLGAINSWSPFLSAIAPSTLFMLAAAGMIWWFERR